MAEVATDVLHNVGNVLNSVNVGCSLSIDRVKSSKISGLSKISALLEENGGRLGEFFTNDSRGQTTSKLHRRVGGAFVWRSVRPVEGTRTACEAH